ncbi:MAG: TolC family protein [Planctomycetes bacterium]|nr:TolC family protein [Planctomycetota bacterium]
MTCSGRRLIAMGLALAAALGGCSRAFYRRQADRETYEILEERAADPQWAIPNTSIDPRRQSRLYDPFDPDRPPMPPDDRAAHEFLHHVHRFRGYSRWHEQGDSAFVESPQWHDSLELSKDGTLVLSPERAVELAVLHSREYQSELEDLYLSALALTLSRFDFDLQWLGTNETLFRHFGTSSTPGESNTLSTGSRLGFRRAFATGGQLIVDFANSFVWEFTGTNDVTAASNLAVNLVQPLLRHAGREVQLEELTQAERGVLYAVRDFARFRKQFYVRIATENFLQLLLQLQGLRNQEANLVSLEQNLRIHEALQEAGAVSLTRVDQVFQRYQEGRLGLLQAQANLETALDNFKVTLGLPPTLPVRLDDSLLAPFQLNDPAVTQLQEETERFIAQYRQLDEAPSLERLKEGFAQLTLFTGRAVKLVALVAEELARWKARIPEPSADQQQKDAQEAQRMARERFTYAQLAKFLEELRNELGQLDKEIAKAAENLAEENRTESWDTLQRLGGAQVGLSGLVAELFVIQTQVRVYLIELRPVEVQSAMAIEQALASRLDLMNHRARVVDAWRQITVAADRLEAGLDVVAGADVASNPAGSNPLKLSAAASRYRVGVQLDGPLNRKTESNIYRATLINYQRARRTYMAAEDGIQQSVRRDLRQLETNRLNFEIARQSLVSAARQVQQTREQVLAETVAEDSSFTQDVLTALNSLLAAKNNLIGTWVSYEANRIQLLLDLENLPLDERGVYTDEHHNRTAPPSSDGDVAGAQAADLRPSS